MLADIEVAAFHLALRGFDGAADDAGFDRLAFRHLELVHHKRDAVTGKDAQQRVFQAQIETAGTRIALTARTAAQLVINPARFVALGADDVQTACGQHLVMQHLPFGLQRGDLRRFGGIVQAFVFFDIAHAAFDTAAQHDIGTATGHVGGDGHLRTGTGLRHDLGFTRMLLGVQHVVRNVGLLEQAAQQFRLFNRGGTHQHRLAAFYATFDIGDDGVVFLVGGLED